MRSSRLLAGVLAMLALPACSFHWDASVRVKRAGHADRQDWVIELRSQLGDHAEARMVDGCATVSIRQSPKRSNHIAITVTDAAGNVVGTAMTHDLARRPFEIPLADGTLMVVTPHDTCSSHDAPE